MKRRLAAAIAALCLFPALPAQEYDLLIRSGRVIDPANGIDERRDIAVADGLIARVAPNIPASEAAKVVDASGAVVTPGLIDLHAHVFGYSGSIFPDDTALLAGRTTVVDCGGAGWRTFERFKRTVVDAATTRVLSFINIVGHGMVGEPYESDLSDMDADATAAKMAEHPDLIVGIKTAHYAGEGWAAIDAAVRAGRLSGKPVMVDDKIFTNTGRHSREKLLERMRPGDLHTHMYNDRQLEVVSRLTGAVQDYAKAARRRGVLFDLGHGGGSFLWPVATRAASEGFFPDTISTDLHQASILGPKSDMANCITKMMDLGMELPEAISRSTVAPAKAIGKYPQLGTLSEGREADIAVFRVETGVFALLDAWRKKKLATARLAPILTVRAGRIVMDVEGLGFPEWTDAGDYVSIP